MIQLIRYIRGIEIVYCWVYLDVVCDKKNIGSIKIKLEKQKSTFWKSYFGRFNSIYGKKNALFYDVKFGLDKAFVFCFEMAITTRNLSASYFARRIGVASCSTRMFMYKLLDAMKSSENFPMINPLR